MYSLFLEINIILILDHNILIIHFMTLLIHFILLPDRLIFNYSRPWYKTIMNYNRLVNNLLLIYLVFLIIKS